MSFGERLRELREAQNMTQKSLAAVLAVSPRMVSFYESGAHFPRDERQLICLADFFHTTTDYLLGCSNIRSVGHLQMLDKAFEILSEEERKSIVEYVEFLCVKARKRAP